LHTGSGDISGQTGCYLDNHPFYSPELGVSGFFCFPALKTALKGKRLQDAEDMKKNVPSKLVAVPLEPFAVFRKFLNLIFLNLRFLSFNFKFQ
jgi:hypothetical protein